jgi:hypothetical protein
MFVFVADKLSVSFEESDVELFPALCRIANADREQEFPGSRKDLVLVRDFLCAADRKKYANSLDFQSYQQLASALESLEAGELLSDLVPTFTLVREDLSVTLPKCQVFVADILSQVVEDMGVTDEPIPFPGTMEHLTMFKNFVTCGDAKDYIQSLSHDEFQDLYLLLHQLSADAVRKELMPAEFQRRTEHMTTREIAKIFTSPPDNATPAKRERSV